MTPNQLWHQLATRCGLQEPIPDRRTLHAMGFSVSYGQGAASGMPGDHPEIMSARPANRGTSIYDLKPGEQGAFIVNGAHATIIRGHDIVLPPAMGPMASAALRRPAGYADMTPLQQWAANKALDIADWDGDPES